MTQIVYATRRVPNMEGRTFRNPSHFKGVEEGTTKVFIDGKWPAIEEAYAKANIPVADASSMNALPTKPSAERKARPARKPKQKADPKQEARPPDNAVHEGRSDG
jgi:hypothetical protein